jgi:hypothetical protein
MTAGKNVLLVLIAALFMPACIDDFEQAAVTASPDGGLRVLYHPCWADDAPGTIELLVDDGDTPGNGNDTVLWEATAGRRPIDTSDVMTFEPGKVPSGYSETVNLHEPRPGDEVLIYVAPQGGGGFVAGFSWGTLGEGRLITDAGSKTAAAWLEYAIEGCGGT